MAVPNTVVIGNRSHLIRTQNFASGSPNWISIKPAGATGVIWNMNRDLIGQGAWLVTGDYASATDGLWRTSNITATPVVWTLVMSQTAAYNKWDALCPGWSGKGFNTGLRIALPCTGSVGIATVGYSNPGVVYRLSGTADPTAVLLPCGNNTWPYFFTYNYFALGIDKIARNPTTGKLYVFGIDVVGNGVGCAAHATSMDDGATWSVVHEQSPGISSNVAIHGTWYNGDALAMWDSGSWYYCDGGTLESRLTSGWGMQGDAAQLTLYEAYGTNDAYLTRNFTHRDNSVTVYGSNDGFGHVCHLDADDFILVPSAKFTNITMPNLIYLWANGSLVDKTGDAYTALGNIWAGAGNLADPTQGDATNYHNCKIVAGVGSIYTYGVRIN